MITQQQLRDDLRHEVGVLEHLATKVPEGQLDWRPPPAQRSTPEPNSD